MRSRGRLEDFDPNKSDPEDSDYDATRARVRKVQKPPRNKTPRRKQRPRADHDGSDDLEETDLDEDDEGSYDEDSREDSELEYDSTTGRPKRKATQKRQVNYEESDRDSIDFMNDVDEETGREPPRKKQRRDMNERKRLIVTLRATPNTRRTSGNTQRPSTADMNLLRMRRSSRIAHDDTETMVALTNSGHHVDVIRTGTRSPEGVPKRAFRGGKGLKKPPSAIFETESEEGLAQTKREAEQEGDHEHGSEVAFSRDPPSPDDEVPPPSHQDDQVIEDKDDILENEVVMIESAVVPESSEEAGGQEEIDDEEDEDIVRSTRRATRRSMSVQTEQQTDTHAIISQSRALRKNLRSVEQETKSESRRRGKRGIDESSDFEPGVDEVAEENVSDSAPSERSPRKNSNEHDSNDSSNVRRSRRRGRSRAVPEDEDESDEEAEIAEEIRELRGSGPSRRAKRKADAFDDNVPQTRSESLSTTALFNPSLPFHFWKMMVLP